MKKNIRYSKCKRFIAYFKTNDIISNCEIKDKKTGDIYKFFMNKIDENSFLINEFQISTYTGNGTKEVDYSDKYCYFDIYQYPKFSIYRIGSTDKINYLKHHQVIFRK